MKEYVIFYFSGTGNTWWAAKNLASILEEKGHIAEIHSIEKVEIEDISKIVASNSHIIIGFPVHGSTAPISMNRFLKNMPSGHGKSISVFATQALGSGDTSYYIGSVLEKKGYNLYQATQFNMMNNFHIPEFRFYAPKNGEKMVKSLLKVKPRLVEFAEKIVTDRKYIRGDNVLGKLLGNIQRKHIDNLIVSTGKLLEVDSKECIDCGLCKKTCPTENISREEEGYIFSNRCILCLRCYSQCPKDAINFGEENKDVEKFPRYKGPTGFKSTVLIKEIEDNNR